MYKARKSPAATPQDANKGSAADAADQMENSTPVGVL